jgi:hypothetical protein
LILDRASLTNSFPLFDFAFYEDLFEETLAVDSSGAAGTGLARSTPL